METVTKKEEIWRFIRTNKELFIDLTDDTRCCVCKNVVVNAQLSECSCTFCRECLLEYLKNTNRCPGTNCHSYEIKIDENVAEDVRKNVLVKKIKIKCPSRNCSYEDCVEKIIDHVKICDNTICPFTTIGCNFNEIGKLVVEKHIMNMSIDHNKLLIESIEKLENKVIFVEQTKLMKINEYGNMKREFEKLKKDNEEFNIIKNELIEEMRKRENENKDLVERMKERENENKDLVKRMKERENENKDIIERMKRMKERENENKDLVERMKERENENKDLVERMKERENENKDIIERMKRMEERENENKDFNELLKKCNEEIEILKKGQCYNERNNKESHIKKNGENLDLNQVKMDENKEKEKKDNEKLETIKNEINIKINKSNEEIRKNIMECKNELSKVRNMKDVQDTKIKEIEKKLNKLQNDKCSAAELVETKKELKNEISQSRKKYFVWKIDNIIKKRKDAKRGINEELYSDSFYTREGGYKLRLVLEPNGNDDGHNKHLSVFICIMKSDYDDILKWPCRENVTFHLINTESKLPYNSFTFSYDIHGEEYGECFIQPTTEFNECFGKPKFVSWFELLNKQNNLIKEGCIYIRVDFDN